MTPRKPRKSVGPNASRLNIPSGTPPPWLKETAVDPLFQAQEIMWDAWDTPDRRKRIAMAKKALKISADCADAYNMLADETARTPREAADLYRKGVEAAERTVGPKVFKEAAGSFWGIMETRPYMRALAGLSMSLWDAGEREEAVTLYRRLLQLNPNDNQGMRYFLLPALVVLGRYDEVEKLLKKYKGDGAAWWLWSRVLYDFRRLGDSPKTRKSLDVALKGNLHVAPLLTGRKPMPRTLPLYYSPGTRDEAILYVDSNLPIWQSIPCALAWLAGAV